MTNSAIAIGRMRTILRDDVFGALRQARADADRIWQSVRPKLTLTREMASSKPKARFAHNICADQFKLPVRYLEVGSFEGESLCFVHALLNGQVQHCHGCTVVRLAGAE